MSTGEIVAAIVSTLLVGAGGVWLFISSQREARRDQELRSMLQPRRDGKLDLQSARTAHRKGLFGLGSRAHAGAGEPGGDDDPDDPEA